MLLMVVVPLAALAVAGWMWLSGGRYVTTDNAYIGADKSLITPARLGSDRGDPCRRRPEGEGGRSAVRHRRLAVPDRAAARQGPAGRGEDRVRESARSYVSNDDQIKMGAEAVRLRQADFDRKQSLLSTHATTQVDTDTSMAGADSGPPDSGIRPFAAGGHKVKLGGGLDATIDRFPEYIQATAQVYDAERNLRNTHVVSPIAGVATQVAQIELGRAVAHGSAVFAVVADHNLWVDGNPKESDLTFVREGLPATVTIDAFPDREWHGNDLLDRAGARARNSPSCRRRTPAETGSRSCSACPLRFCFDPDQDTTNLRAGMSADISIDTGRTRSLRSAVDGLAGWIDDLVHPASAKAAPAK